MGGRGASSGAVKYAPQEGTGTLPPGRGREDDEEQEPDRPQTEQVAALAAGSGDSPPIATFSLPPGETAVTTEVIPSVRKQSGSTSVSAAIEESQLPQINIINQETALGGAIYPFLEQTGRAWVVVSSDLENPTQYPRNGTFGMTQPTIRYVKDNKIEDVFVDGMTTEQFLAKTGLQFSMDKGGFVLSKRLSRIMRPYFASGSFPAESLNIQYIDQSETEKKVWDGAGLINQATLKRLVIPPETPPAKRAELLRELAECKRVEFTIMTDKGQDKGHAIVADELDADFVLPVDTKKEVKLVNGQTWVGVNFVHAHDEMRVDIQSLINLYPFFDETQYAQWLDDEGKLFTAAVESGKVDAAMSRIDPFATMEDVEAWHLREYFASGGHAMWSASITRNLMNQHLKRLNETTLEKMRLPVPGGRYYVMPIGVGQAAGFDHDIPRGGVRIDPEYATAWVNDEDWVQMQDSPSGAGIRDILGGADNDDALWIHPFTDHDDVPKMLAWRSPNQAGEYVVLAPTIGSRILEWETVDGAVTFPPADSRKLFARTDTVACEYLGLIDQSTVSGLGKGKPYSVEVMDETIERAKANAGGLGMYCNMLMLSKAIYGGLPKKPPAPLEDFIDSAVKTGADITQGRDWCYEASQAMIRTRQPIPRLLVGRLSASREDKAIVPTTTDHWLDRLTGVVRTHIDDFRAQRDTLTAKTMPPARLFDHAFNIDEREHLQTGIALNKLYSRVRGKLLHSKKAGDRLDEADMTTIREQLDHFLSRFDEREHGAILRGAMVAAYLDDEPSDAALWMLGAKTEHGHLPGMAQRTIRALREVGILDEIGAEVNGGVMRYPGATISEPSFERSIGINAIWFNWYCRQRVANGEPLPAQLGDVPKKAAKEAKARVTELAQTHLRSFPVTIQRASYVDKRGQTIERLGAFSNNGDLLGLVTPDSEGQLAEGQQITLKFALAADGNVRAVWE
ncbi:MAG: hypothetical protein ACYDBJ_13325 [Aggregatilineales bacterium]